MTYKSVVAAVVVSLAGTGLASAADVAALVGNDTIAMFDASAMKVTKSMKVTGLDGALVGIDVRPADGLLYGVTGTGAVYTIAMDGRASMKSKLETMLPAGVTATIDFNPAADRLRVIGSDGTSLRANVDDGKVTTDGSLKYAANDANQGKTPKVVAAAYTNSVKGTKETALYDIDAALGTLVKQAPPNDGILNTVGMLGTGVDTIAFDIASDGSKNTGWAIVNDELWTIDLGTGKAARAGKVTGLPGRVRDIAALPAM
jgi:hypothetical protein